MDKEYYKINAAMIGRTTLPEGITDFITDSTKMLGRVIYTINNDIYRLDAPLHHYSDIEIISLITKLPNDIVLEKENDHFIEHLSRVQVLPNDKVRSSIYILDNTSLKKIDLYEVEKILNEQYSEESREIYTHCFKVLFNRFKCIASVIYEKPIEKQKSLFKKWFKRKR
jgi:hypothetical protein